ncbi:MAG: DUF5009 domain-containing protein, partial [Melioribacteraceae bacterium]|nr:DUF5009 domain-containing protein [Melioribacteraceae bacterium]
MCYWFIDVLDIKWWIKPFHIYGMNAITVFFLSGLMAKLMHIIKVTDPNGESISLKSYIFQNVYLSIASPINASLFFALSYITFWLFLMWILYRKNIIIKI